MNCLTSYQYQSILAENTTVEPVISRGEVHPQNRTAGKDASTLARPNSILHHGWIGDVPAGKETPKPHKTETEILRNLTVSASQVFESSNSIHGI